MLFLLLLAGCRPTATPTPGVAFPRELTDFTQQGDAPVFQGAGPGHWDAAIRERGWVLFDSGVYKLWYTGYDGTPTGRRMLGLATSPDGQTWTRNPNNPLTPDRWVEDVMVVRDGKNYLMVAEGEADRAQLLTSTDGIKWESKGTLDIRLTTGKPIPTGPFGTPTLFRDKTRWLLYYERNDAGVWLAASDDLKTWTNLQDDPILTPGPAEHDHDMIALDQVLERDGRYYAYYHGCAATGPNTKKWSCALAASDDLRHWTKYPGNPLTPIEANRSSGALVTTPHGTRFVTTHPAVWWYEVKP